MLTIRVEHVANVLPDIYGRDRASGATQPRPYIGLAWFGTRRGTIHESVVLVRGRSFTETLYATEAAAQAIDRYAPAPVTECYEGIAGDRVRFEARNQGCG